MNGWEKGGELDGEYQNFNQISVGVSMGKLSPCQTWEKLKEKALVQLVYFWRSYCWSGEVWMNMNAACKKKKKGEDEIWCPLSKCERQHVTA